MIYLVVCGDIVAAHLIKDRRAAQKTFQTAIKLTAFKFEDRFISALTNTSGDHFEMVLKNADDLFPIIAHLEFSVPSLTMRYGLGAGVIETEINPLSTAGMDGMAFRFARQAHQRARKNKTRFAFEADDEKSPLIDLLLQWMGSEQQRWTPSKIRAYALYKRGFKQQVIAQRLHISQPAVSRMVRSFGQKLSLQTERQIAMLLNSLLQKAA